MVLRCCARVSMDLASERRLELLVRGKLDWGHIVDAAADHGLTPLVARHLANRFADQVPPDVLRTLRARAFAIGARNLMLTRELLRVVATLRAAGVPCLPFKGPLVAADVYGDLALREFGDLDVVIPERLLRAGRRALVSEGYRSAYGLSEVQELALLRAHGHLTLVRDGSDAPVELHWRFAPDCFPSLDVEDALTRVRWVTLAGQRVPSLGPEDLLLTLCIHGGKHVWSSLEWVCGVAELLRRGDVDLDAVIRAADRLRCRRLLRLGLRVAHELLDAPLPRAILADVAADETTTRLAAEVYRTLSGDRTIRSATESSDHHLGYHVRAQDSVVGRLRFLYHVTMLPTPAEWADLRLPDWLVPAYRVARPLRLASKYARRLIGPHEAPHGIT